MANLTKRDILTALHEVVLDLPNSTFDSVFTADVFVKFIDHEIDLLDRKYNASPNPKREAEKNAAIA